MARFITAIALGYLVMFAAVMGIFAAAYPFVGSDTLFEPGTYVAARGWILLSFGVSLVAAMAGGIVCARIAPGAEAPIWLATVVLVLGALMAIPVVANTDSGRGGSRPAYVTMSQAIAHAEQPVWAALLNPLIGAIGVLVGAGPRTPRE